MKVTQVDLNSVRSAVCAVTDPEYPDLTIQQLGILENVVADSEGIRVDLVPAISGCPALQTIEQDVRSAAEACGYEIKVRFCSSPVWTPDRISDDARIFLAKEYSVAIRPKSGSVECPICGKSSLQHRSDVGPTACRSVEWCPDCRNPIEVVRSRRQPSDG